MGLLCTFAQLVGALSLVGGKRQPMSAVVFVARLQALQEGFPSGHQGQTFFIPADIYSSPALLEGLEI